MSVFVLKEKKDKHLWLLVFEKFETFPNITKKAFMLVKGREVDVLIEKYLWLEWKQFQLINKW